MSERNRQFSTQQDSRPKPMRGPMGFGSVWVIGMRRKGP